MAGTMTIYRRACPAKYRWLVEEQIDQALKDLEGLPEWTGDLTTGECFVLITLSRPHQETPPEPTP